MADGATARDGAQGNADGPDARWRATLLARRPVVEVHRAERMGVVEDVVFDARRSLVAGLLVGTAGREGSVLGAARRALGGTGAQQYVEAAQVVALNDEVVTVDLELPALEAEQPATLLPRLSQIRDFEVVTILGRRLGRFLDLLLDDAGRAVVGYLVAPAGRIANDERPDPTFPEFGPSPAFGPSVAPPETGAVEPPARERAAGREPSRCLVVPAALDVRVGRDLIVVAPAPATPAAPSWPARSSHEAGGAGQEAEWSDAPTEALLPDDGQVCDGDAPTSASPA